ncbi:MAG: FGGY-family carbohydrate kinase [Granulosicoccus sp.]
MSRYLLGIDSGGTMTKAALFTLDGHEIAAQFSPVTMLFPEPGFTERDPVGMWNATCEAIKSIIATTGIDNTEIAAVSATGYGSGLFCVDAQGNPTCNAIVSTDSRAVDIMEEWHAAGYAEKAEPILTQRFWPAQSLVLLGWFQKHRPDIMANTATIFECKDYTKMRLTGQRTTDVTDAALGGLLNMYDQRYATDLMIELGLEQWIDKLPTLAQPEDIAGEVTEEAAQQTGLRKGTPVATGAIDIICSNIASGVVDPSQLSIVAGTWSINNAVRANQPQTSLMPMAQMPYLIPNTYLATEASATSASNLEWCCNNVFDAEKTAATATGESIYDRCGRMVQSRRDNPSDVMFMPYLFGSEGNKPAGFIGLEARHERADLVYAVYESIVYSHKMHIDLLKSASDTSPQSIRLSGGAARSDEWAQLFSDVLGLPVEVASGTEFGAFGASICAAVGIGTYADYSDAVTNMVRVSKRFEPDPKHAERHAARYDKFLRVGAALADSWST